MIKDIPFIHLLQSPYGYYIFDVNTNSILKTSEEVYDYLKREQTDSFNECKYEGLIKSKIDVFREAGYLSENRPEVIEHPQNDCIEHLLKRKLSKLTIQVTQQCNLMCSYCPYSYSNNSANRKHSNKKMDFPTAKRAIDLLLNNSSDSGILNIGFYGGEPLLEYNLIKACIDYVEKRAEGRTIGFSITTNGTLLNDEITEFLWKYNISTIISLDGPSHIHDKQRRFSANGSGTFNVIEKNIKNIREKYPQFFKNIRYNVVIDPQEEIKCVNDFFVNYEMFESANVKANILDDTYSSERTHRQWNFVEQIQYENFKAYLSHYNRVDLSHVSPLAKRSLVDLKNMAEGFGDCKRLSNRMSHSGPCIPGVKRVFVDAYGNLYPCERVSELSDAMKIGHLKTGFEIEKVKEILNIGKLTENKCRNCWAIRHCTLCAKMADNLKGLSSELISSKCSMVKKTFENKLKDYIALKEVEKYYKELIS